MEAALGGHSPEKQGTQQCSAQCRTRKATRSRRAMCASLSPSVQIVSYPFPFLQAKGPHCWVPRCRSICLLNCELTAERKSDKSAQDKEFWTHTSTPEDMPVTCLFACAMHGARRRLQSAFGAHRRTIRPGAQTVWSIFRVDMGGCYIITMNGFTCGSWFSTVDSTEKVMLTITG